MATLRQKQRCYIFLSFFFETKQTGMKRVWKYISFTKTSILNAQLVGSVLKINILLTTFYKAANSGASYLPDK